MTPDRLQEIRQRLENAIGFCTDANFPATFVSKEDLQDFLAALATAEAEGRQQGIEEIRDQWRNTADNDTDLFSAWLRQLLPPAPRG